MTMPDSRQKIGQNTAFTVLRPLHLPHDLGKSVVARCQAPPRSGAVSEQATKLGRLRFGSAWFAEVRTSTSLRQGVQAVSDPVGGQTVSHRLRDLRISQSSAAPQPRRPPSTLRKHQPQQDCSELTLELTVFVATTASDVFVHVPRERNSG